MRLTVILILLSLCLSANAETRMRDVYAAMPDSIFPLLTQCNRLDQIDFCENGMPAVVKNRFDEQVELLQLTDRYLKLQLSKHCLVEMRLLSDSTFCMVETFLGPAPDSSVRLMDAAWRSSGSKMSPPSPSDFMADDIDEEVCLSLKALPIISASLSPDDNTITWQLQTSELAPSLRDKAEGKVRPIVNAIN